MALTSPTTGGGREILSASGLNGARPDLALDLPRDARAKLVTMAIAGRKEIAAGEAPSSCRTSRWWRDTS